MLGGRRDPNKRETALWRGAGGDAFPQAFGHIREKEEMPSDRHPEIHKELGVGLRLRPPAVLHKQLTHLALKVDWEQPPNLIYF